MIKKQWLKDDEEFFEQLFAYLKEKFSSEVPNSFHMQKNTGQAIYNETIVALENLYKVLRKIENGSFYKRADFEKAKKEGDKDKIQEIANFYQGLLFFRNEKLKYALSATKEFYVWDYDVTRYFRFIETKVVREQFNEFWTSKAESEKSINLDKVFDFVNEYLNYVQESVHAELLPTEEKSIEENVKQSTDLQDKRNELKANPKNMAKSKGVFIQIENQNKIYELLNESFGRIKKQKIGICVFDITLPSRFKFEENNPRIMSAIFIRKLLDDLEFWFSRDEGVLIRVNHTHVVSENKVMLSFLLVYQVRKYKSQQEVFSYYKAKIYSELGRILNYDTSVINRGEMIDKIYPKEKFIGELRTEKQKIAFQEKFLRYFYSSIFILEADKVSDFVENETTVNRYLNDFKFYESKIYNFAKPKNNANGKIINDLMLKRKIEYLGDLLTPEIIENAEKHFPLADISEDGLNRLKIITYLYHQHWSALEGVNEQIIFNLLQAEKFITWLMHENWYHGFKSTLAQKKFETTPTFSKLSMPFKQVLLISNMIKSTKNIFFPRYLKTEAIKLLNNFEKIFPRNTRLDQIELLESDLQKYKKDYLHPVMEKEKLFFKRAVLTETRVKKYLKRIFEKNLIIVRFVFDCGQFGDENDSAKLFDEMFREYIENLKRRRTVGLKLFGHVATYIPEINNHYIDGTLFFEFDLDEDIDPVTLIEAVVQFWENYVQNKDTQISERNKRIGKPYTGNQINPFDIFRNKKLRATSVNIVKTEIELNHKYIKFYKGRNKTQNKLIEKISMFYAYCPLILVDEKNLEYLPRKDCLILGRIREKKGNKRNSDGKQNNSENSADRKSTHVETNLQSKSIGIDQPETISQIQNIEESMSIETHALVDTDSQSVNSNVREDRPPASVIVKRGARKQHRIKPVINKHEDG